VLGVLQRQLQFVMLGFQWQIHLVNAQGLMGCWQETQLGERNGIGQWQPKNKAEID
jgi:hypothetical protein